MLITLSRKVKTAEFINLKRGNYHTWLENITKKRFVGTKTYYVSSLYFPTRLGIMKLVEARCTVLKFEWIRCEEVHLLDVVRYREL